MSALVTSPVRPTRPALTRLRRAGGLAFGLMLPLGAGLVSPLSAQTAAKPITQDVYDLWRGIVSPTLSPDGQWVAYTNSPSIGDGTLMVRATSASTEFSVARGFTGRPNDRPSATGGFSPAAASFSGDGRHVAALIYPTRAEVEAARRDRRRAAEANRTTLALMALPSGQVTNIPRVRSFRFARDGGAVLVYQLEADSARNGNGRDSAGAARPAAPAAGARDTTRRATPRRESGSPLVVRTLATGAEVRIEDVTAFTLDDAEKWLAYVVGDTDSTKAGLFLRDLTNGTVHTLRGGRARYRGLTFDRTATQLAFLEAPYDTIAPARAEYTIWHAPLVTRRNAPPVATAIVGTRDADAALRIPERSTLEFTRDGSALQFGIAPPPPDSIPADSLADKAVYDLWHWQDTRLQPTQALQAGRDRNRTYSAIHHPKLRKTLRLADDSLPQVQVSDDGKLALAVTSVPYEIESMWGESGNDVWLIDAVSGARTLVVKRIEGRAQFSPNAKFVTWFEKDQWHAYEVATKQTRTLTTGIQGIRFSQETWSTPSTPAAWGLGGWTNDDRDVLVNDRYDVWVLDPRGVRAPRRLTGGVGRRTQHVFRVLALDPEARTIDPTAPVLFEAFDDVSKGSGWYRGSFTDSAPQQIVMAPKSWGRLQKARKGEQLLVTRSDYREFPDLWSGTSLTSLSRISDGFPQQAEYRRGNVRLHSWISADGDSLAGLLYTPDGFDPSKKYPMVVYFYETHSDGLHGYVRPAGRNIVNPTVYNSLGYIVFMPDIKYTDGYPGPSAYKSIVPGVQSLIQAGFVNKDAIGIGGQSWGGYQTAYLVTQTNIFKAAVPNATVVNMTSAYGGIRWGTGISRSFQYERGQSRIGGSLWEFPERYIENSPLFHADRIQTPVLFMANDNDGAVPWYQGIEFFIAMRRLGKEAYMINYNGDEHNPTKRANQLDIDQKQLEFFDHHLRGGPKPAWMQRGIPFLDKGRDQLRGGATVP